MDTLNDVLAHFGVKGMKWGVRRNNGKKTVSPRSAKRLDTKIAKHETAIKNSKARMKIFEKDAEDLLNNGYKSAPMQRRYGRSVDQSYVGFTLTNGINRIDATQQLIVETGMNIRAEQRALKRNEKRLAKLKAKKKNSVVKHDDLVVEETLEDVLEHFGVKGMKWGVRKDKGHEGQRAKNTKIAKLDKKFERRAASWDTFVKVNNAAAKQYNEHDLNRINNKPQYKNADFTRDTPLRRKYYKEHSDAMLDRLEKAANDFGTNASGTKKYGVIELDGRWDITIRDVKHADDVVGSFKILFNDTGHIVGVEVIPTEMAQTDLSFEDFLEHFGIKGMKWGVRRAPKVDTSSDDAKAATAASQKAKKTGVKSLSNQELQQLVNRMNLEQQLSRLKESQPSKFQKGKKVVQEIISAAKMANDVANLANSTTGKLVKSKLGV